MKRKMYLARRIASNTNPDTCLPVSSAMSVDELLVSYANKKIEYQDYIHNGHWILRPVQNQTILADHYLPESLNAEHVWSAVAQKINTSDALVAFLNPTAFGTIAEVGYAAGSKRIAVYVLPEPHLSKNDITELWLSFQIAFSTRELWDQRDIDCIAEFRALGIDSIEAYAEYIQNIIPPFLIK